MRLDPLATQMTGRKDIGKIRFFGFVETFETLKMVMDTSFRQHRHMYCPGLRNLVFAMIYEFLNCQITKR